MWIKFYFLIICDLKEKFVSKFKNSLSSSNCFFNFRKIDGKSGKNLRDFELCRIQEEAMRWTKPPTSIANTCELKSTRRTWPCSPTHSTTDRTWLHCSTNCVASYFWLLVPNPSIRMLHTRCMLLFCVLWKTTLRNVVWLNFYESTEWSVLCTKR